MQNCSGWSCKGTNMYLQLEKKKINEDNVKLLLWVISSSGLKSRNSTFSHYAGEKTSILMMPTIAGDI